MTNLLFQVLRTTYPDGLMNRFLNDDVLVKQHFDSHEDLIAAHLACLAEACHREDPKNSANIFTSTLTTIIDELSAVQLALAKVEEILRSEHTHAIHDTLCSVASVFFPQATSATLHVKRVDTSDTSLEVQAIDFYTDDGEKFLLTVLSSTERDAGGASWFDRFRKPLEQGDFEPGPYSLPLYLPNASSEDISADVVDLELTQSSDVLGGD
jgi:hypothetical protein